MIQKRITVVKIGGSTFKTGDTTLEDLVTLQKEGHALVVVHGGGDAITGWLDRLDIKSPFHGGYRVTDQNTLVVVVAVLAGLVNKLLVSAVNALGGRAFGFSGADGRLVEARVKNEDLGLVGEADRVNTEVIDMVLRGGYIPIIAPVGWRPPGAGAGETLLNLNGDTMTGALAAALGAERLIFLTDVDGILGKDGKLIETVSADGISGLTASGVIKGGMIPKVEACLAALKKTGVTRIINGTVPHALLNEMRGRGRGTKVVASSK
ncbi:MAG: acetylglutamate kinase [Chloroflexi bacterium]|nr:acetylglutamate kinase [Chloroflexota bacterium]